MGDGKIFVMNKILLDTIPLLPPYPDPPQLILHWDVFSKSNSDKHLPMPTTLQKV